jgi:hypothetical protein
MSRLLYRLSYITVARPDRFERPTARVEAGCSDPLNYGRKYLVGQARFELASRCRARRV